MARAGKPDFSNPPGFVLTDHRKQPGAFFLLFGLNMRAVKHRRRRAGGQARPLRRFYLPGPLHRVIAAPGSKPDQATSRAAISRAIASTVCTPV